MSMYRAMESFKDDKIARFDPTNLSKPVRGNVVPIKDCFKSPKAGSSTSSNSSYNYPYHYKYLIFTTDANSSHGIELYGCCKSIQGLYSYREGCGWECISNHTFTGSEGVTGQSDLLADNITQFNKLDKYLRLRMESEETLAIMTNGQRIIDRAKNRTGENRQESRGTWGIVPYGYNIGEPENAGLWKWALTHPFSVTGGGAYVSPTKFAILNAAIAFVVYMQFA